MKQQPKYNRLDTSDMPGVVQVCLDQDTGELRGCAITLAHLFYTGVMEKKDMDLMAAPLRKAVEENMKIFEAEAS